MNRPLWVALGIVSCSVQACAAPPRASDRARADVAAGAMVSLPGGRFLLHQGSGPYRDVPTFVAVRPFALDATEVTVAAYSECVRAGRCTAPSATVSWELIRDSERARWSPSCNQERAERGDHPVNCVDWRQATAYCAFAGKRLPTEEEWEWAARSGGDATLHPWGDAPPAGRVCWNGQGNDAGRGQRSGTCAAGSHPADASAAGVRDLAGGVSEWTSSETVVNADSEGRNGTPVKVFRGGAWSDEDARRLTSASRSADLRARRDAALGFRCASDP